MRFIIYILVIPIKGYQLVLSPFFGPSCRFQPTCSTYAIDALRKHGVIQGLWLTVKRLVKCNPWGGRGFDPVPEKKNNIFK